eukprot:8968201-Pyramimonas_sp.AAC.1
MGIKGITLLTYTHTYTHHSPDSKSGIIAESPSTSCGDAREVLPAFGGSDAWGRSAVLVGLRCEPSMSVWGADLDGGHVARRERGGAGGVRDAHPPGERDLRGVQPAQSAHVRHRKRHRGGVHLVHRGQDPRVRLA